MRFFLNLQQMTIVRGLSVDINILDLMSCLPRPRAMFYFFSSITTDFNISSALSWAIQDQWSSGSFFYLCFTAHQDYFTHFEPSQSWAGFALPIAIVAKCEEKTYLAQKNFILQKQVEKKNSPHKKIATDQ